MTNFAKNIVQIKPEFKNKSLFLANKDRNGLFMLPNISTHIVIKLHENGEVLVSDTYGCRQPSASLSDIGRRYLHMNAPSENEMLGYLVLPEMEVERIFNAVRFKYLRAIHLSNIKNPADYINSAYNRAFQALSGLVVYQGNPIRRKENDAFWQEAGFSAEAKDQDWQKEQYELHSILTSLKRISFKPVTRVYAELIAIKPGFHELYLHDDYFDDEMICTGKSPREMVFRMLKCKEELTSLLLDRFPLEMNKRSYYGYAPCQVTEGPFVFRKGLGVSYFDEIRRIKTRKQIHALTEKFHILDYYNHDISTQQKLGKFLELAEHFCRYIA